MLRTVGRGVSTLWASILPSAMLGMPGGLERADRLLARIVRRARVTPKAVSLLPAGFGQEASGGWPSGVNTKLLMYFVLLTRS